MFKNNQISDDFFSNKLIEVIKLMASKK